MFIISQSSKLSELKGRLDTLESKKGLHEQVDKIQNEFIHKLQQRATELHDSTQTQLNHSARLTVEIVQQWEQVKLEIEQEMKALRQKRVSTRLAGLEVQIRWLWWSSLDEQWQAIFKEAIGIKSEPTEDELVAIRSLTKLDCHEKELTSLELLRVLTGLQFLVCYKNQLTNLEPLRALTGLQTLNCRENQLTSLEPLHGLKSLKKLDCRFNSSLSQPEIERFKKAVPSCEVQI